LAFFAQEDRYPVIVRFQYMTDLLMKGHISASYSLCREPRPSIKEKRHNENRRGERHEKKQLTVLLPPPCISNLIQRPPPWVTGPI
jgi:hypothetical protein